ncbi:hypothetical protein ACFQ9X_19430 [Catenulispora yoronensis]
MADPGAAGVLEQAWADAGLVCPVRVVSDVTVSFAAGTPHADGTLLVSGTGAVAARMHDRLPALFRDGYGWLLGDDGSGFWIGRQAARATIAAADGRAPMAELAKAVLEALLDQSPDSSPTTGRTGSATSGRTWPESGLGLGLGGGGGEGGGAGGGRGEAGLGNGGDGRNGGAPTVVRVAGQASDRASDRASDHASDHASDTAPGTSDAGTSTTPSTIAPSNSAATPGKESNPPDQQSPSRSAAIGEGFGLRGRRRASELVRAVSAQPTVALARLAPLVMAAYELGDPAARRIVEEAARVLVDSLAGVGPVAGQPVVLGGSVLVSRSPVFDAVAAAVGRRWPDSPIGLAHDGAAGATWLAAREVLGARDGALVHAAFTNDDRWSAKFS